MDASADVAMTDKLGRRSGPRRRYTLSEKRAMVEETHAHGASVPEVAQRHGVNANLLSVWRRQHKFGKLADDVSREQPMLLPVKVGTPTLVPSERAMAQNAPKRASAQIEVEFAGGHRLRICSGVDRPLLRELIRVLSGR